MISTTKFSGIRLPAGLVACTLIFVLLGPGIIPHAIAASDTTGPSVKITSPSNGGTYSGNITWSATVTDTGGVSLVYFYIDDMFIQSVVSTTSSYTTLLNTALLSNGQHKLSVYAWDKSFNRGEAHIFISSSNTDTTKPVVTIEKPLNGDTVSGTYQLAIRANDANGVKKMEFYVDGVLHSALDNPPLETTSAGTFYYFRPSWNTASAANGSHSLLAKAYDIYNNVGTRSISVTVSNSGSTDTTKPTVSVTSPSNGSTVSGTITFSASASDNKGVSKVQFYVDGSFKASDTTSPYSFSLDTKTLSDGSHTFKAIAFDTSNNQASHQVSATVSNSAPSPDTTDPFVSVTSPSNGSTVSGTIGVSASASDRDSGIYRVYFYVDGAYKGYDASSPYTYNLDTKAYADGSHKVRALAYDNALNSASHEISVSVKNTATSSDTTKPTVSVTSPSNGSTVSGTITFSASASDNKGVSKVQFYVDGSFKASDTTSPYSFSLDTKTLSDGSHTFKAIAFDTSNNQASHQVSATVSNTVKDTTAPTVSITSPSNGETVRGTITFSASASDNKGVSKVQFYVGGSLVGTDTTSPYSMSLDTSRIKNGQNTLMVRAYDLAGNIDSDSITVKLVGS